MGGLVRGGGGRGIGKRWGWEGDREKVGVGGGSGRGGGGRGIRKGWGCLLEIIVLYNHVFKVGLQNC